ncbi:response regulator [Paucibacter sp. TC2R-5]|uniref:response regulator n=1 Tax=Paucibacter sp. TC2R-5 TaxID=2893555 RepID=UPI0021E4B7D8|nr:response regulator [Paucibacter sp. TC2R-5]MCV2357613.1 response regulator [Paucibacter sp. TC2R-5]
MLESKRLHGLSGGLDPSRMKALIIDEGELSRSVLSNMLRDMGVPTVHSARRPESARSMIKNASPAYDIIITDFHFTPQSSHDLTGQDLLDELRQARGLPMQTAFIMVTDEARYQHVADAVEGALDDYLLKPFNARQFDERLRVILERKYALREVFAAIDAGEFGQAASLCEAMFAASATYRVYAARIGSELYLRLGQIDAAKRMFEALLATKAVPWARLGLAKIELANADSATACRTLETLLADNPAYVDAYDVYGRALLEEMKFEAAVDMLAKAVQITPGNVARLQKLGSLQLFLGDSESAARHLGAALTIGLHSRALDFQGVVALGIACLDIGDEEGCARAQQCLQDAIARYPTYSFRLQMLSMALETAMDMLSRRQEASLAGLGQMAAQLDQTEFSFEMACNLLQLLARCARNQRVPGAMRWAELAAQRFAISKPRTRLLEMATGQLPSLETVVRNAAGAINEAARDAMTHLVSKQHQRTLEALLELAGRSLNARIIKLAQATLSHHGRHLTDEVAQRMSESLGDLQQRYVDGGRRIVERSE